MSNISFFQGWDRTSLDLSSKMAEPFCLAWRLLRFRLVAPLDPTKFENCDTKVKEVAVRALIVAGALIGCAFVYFEPSVTLWSLGLLGLGSRCFRALGFALQKDGYTHVRGSSSEKALDLRNLQLKVMNWNVCGIGGGLSLNRGGVIPWRSRLDRIVAKIKEEDPEVLVLQEIYDTALAESLIKKLKTDYAHFYIHLGPNSWGSVGGGMVITKCPVHRFSNTSFTNNHWTLNRGFASLEIKASPTDSKPCIRIIGTHLFHCPEDRKLRKEQIEQIVASVRSQTRPLPTILMGDLNMERDNEEGQELLSYFNHGYLGEAPTATNRLTFQWDGQKPPTWDEWIDYISRFKDTPRATLSGCHLVEAFDPSNNTKTALSDHHGLSALIKVLTSH